MQKNVYDSLTVFVSKNTDSDEYDVFNAFTNEQAQSFTFEDAQTLVDFIRHLQKVDNCVLKKTVEILSER